MVNSRHVGGKEQTAQRQAKVTKSGDPLQQLWSKPRFLSGFDQGAVLCVMRRRGRPDMKENCRNFSDPCVLEFCKLFGELEGKHGWRRIVPERKTFERELFANLNMSQAEFEAYVADHRRERDKIHRAFRLRASNANSLL